MNTQTALYPIAHQNCLQCEKPLASGQSNYCCSGCEALYGVLHTQNSEWAFWDEGSLRKKTIYVDGIHCASCVTLLEKLPHVLPEHVFIATVDYSHSLLEVTLTPDGMASEVGKQLKKWGYSPSLVEGPSNTDLLLKKENKKRLVELGVAGALAGNIMLMSIPLYSGVDGTFEKIFEWISFALAVPSFFYSGRTFIQSLYQAITQKAFSIDAPVALAMTIAFFYSTYSLFAGTHELYFDSLSGLIFLLLSSRYLLFRMKQHSTLNIDVLNIIKKPFTGAVGDLVTPQHGTLSFDAVVIQGEVWVDASRFSGESEPVCLLTGDSIFAGMDVISKSADASARVTALNEDTRLALLLRKALDFRKNKTRIEILSDRLAKSLLVVVTVVGLLSLAYFSSTGNLQEGLKRFLALIIVTCPCALALATPLVFARASNHLLKNGVLVKDPESLDALLTVDTACFDKTGTLTLGQLSILSMNASMESHEASILLEMTLRSRHPVSKAIARRLQQDFPSLQSTSLDTFQEIIGKGLRSSVNGKEYTLEKNTFRDSEHVIASFETVDQVRPETPSLIHFLKHRGLNSKVISGDTLAHALKALGEIKDLQYFTEQSPEEKAELVQNALMVGDGVNDSLALSKSKVSIAVQGGMEAAIASSQIYLMQPNLNLIIKLFETADHVRKSLITNFVMSTTYNVIGATLALSGNLTPLAAALLMPLSATTVFFYTQSQFKEKAA